jgi:DNA-binding PadR family transcriptional regulator
MERKLLLLGMLRETSMYGYQINELIDTHLGTSVRLTKPTAYRFLNQMAEEGWITFTEKQEGNRPTRRVYSIAPDGESAFQGLLRESLVRFEPAASHSTIAIAFMDALPAEDTLALLHERRETIEETRDGLAVDTAHHGGFEYLILHQVRHLDTELEWLDEIIKHITEQGGQSYSQLLPAKAGSLGSD